jgi:hypothetical protein
MLIAKSRATLSVGPPAANGTTMEIGLEPGKLCACATNDRAAAAMTNKRFIFIS